jgi:nicotinamide-nucleotide amidase
MAANNRRQTYLVDGAEVLPNGNGTAPGQLIRAGDKVLILLPGPPRELKPMVLNEVIPRLKRMLPKEAIKVRSFRIAGMGESDLDTLIAPIYTRYENPATTVLSGVGDLWVHLRARCATEAEADTLLKEVGDPIAELLGDRIYTTDSEQPLEDVVGNLLRQQQATVATAESCTGGLIAERLTEKAGSSDYFLAGFVTYSDEQKAKILGVSQDLLARCGAVSEPVAAAMAEGAKSRSQATYALSTTGFSGPGGGTEQNPVGTVYIGLAGPGPTQVTRMHFGSDRYRHRLLSAQTALDILRRQLLNSD